MKVIIPIIFILVVFFASLANSYSQFKPAILENASDAYVSPLSEIYLKPKKIIWQSESGVNNAEKILDAGFSQALLTDVECLQLTGKASLILDFGCELQGGIRITTTKNNKKSGSPLRIRFGESVAEANSDVDCRNSTNDHSFRDITSALPWLGSIELGNTGFRFVRIDLLDSLSTVEIKEITARFRYRNIDYAGSFKCNDELLNKIWLTGAYTVHLNMQEFLWDGIKRDRLIWVGDMHPEVMTINTVFGKNEIVPQTLDFIRDSTPKNEWMNGISAYSIWWILIQKDWFLYQGDFTYLKEQEEYLLHTLKKLSTKIDGQGKEILDGWRFLDWPTSKDTTAIHAGLQALLKKAFEVGSYFACVLNNEELDQICQQALKKMSTYKPSVSYKKQADALLALAGLQPAEYVNKNILSKNGSEGFSTFYGYYILQAQAKAGDYIGALNNIREYWGGMIALGATTFWEDFDVKWIKNAAKLDEIPSDCKIDVHGTYGDFCYPGFRKSLCHGWASGPTAWLSQYVLGIVPLEPGCKKVKIVPHLGDLTWVQGTFPTPYGLITIKHSKDFSGKIISNIQAPKQIEIVDCHN